jgi:hypothetical protein
MTRVRPHEYRECGERTLTTTFVPDTKEEDLIHPEDIAHFKKHELEADAEERQEMLDAMSIVEQNIPAKFRRAA